MNVSIWSYYKRVESREPPTISKKKKMAKKKKWHNFAEVDKTMPQAAVESYKNRNGNEIDGKRTLHKFLRAPAEEELVERKKVVRRKWNN